MKIILYSALFSLACNALHAQSGCTDPAANNFNSSASANDGSCLYNPTGIGYSLKGQVNSFANESSGVVFANGALWTHNDSGNPSKIFKTDTSGHLLQTISITNFPNVDWEDITADSNYIYIEDAGNNDGNRTDLKILKIDKGQFLQNPAATVNATAQAISFSYADQTSFVSNSNSNFDCESLISIGDSLYIFTKDEGDLQTRVYKLPKNPGTYTVSPYTSYNVNGRITGAGYNKQTKEIALIGYFSGHKNSFIWFLNNYHGDMFFSGNKRRVELGNSVNDWQTEGIDYYSTKELFFSCENSGVPASIFNTFKSYMSPVGIKTIDPNQQIKLYPNPASDELTVELNSYDAGEIMIYNMVGEAVLSVTANSLKSILNIADLKPGAYFISVSSSGRSYSASKFIKF